MISQLRMKNFRRFEDQTIRLDQGLSYIEGKNNAGKTTIFLAIEYGFFGTVTGFRSQSALFQPNKKKMGVEIFYKGRDGKNYKLQRVHELKGRGATGHYTLKEVIDDDTEKYIISSDFSNTSEEMLQLQIFETLGISKRLFDVALNIRQGEITSILEGNKYLDIVLGVSAAVLAQKQLNSVALGYEKETSQYDTFQATFDGFVNEKKELEKQQGNLQKEIDNLKQTSNKLESNLKKAEKDIQQLQPVMQSYQTYHGQCQVWDRAHEKLHEQLGRLEKLEKEAGDTENIRQILIEVKKKIEDLDKESQKTGQKRDNETILLRQFEQEIGDLKGKINRRKNLPEGDVATCEECGAVIDHVRVKQELETWQKEQEEVQEKIKHTEGKIEKLQEREKEIQQTIREHSSKLSQYESILKQIQDAEKEKNTLQQNLENQNEALLDAAVDLYEKLQNYNERKEENNKITIPRPDIAEIESRVDIDKDVMMARSMDTIYTEKLESENTKLKETNDEIKVEFRVISGQFEDRKNQKENLKPRLEQINKQMADTKSQLQKLEKKKIAAEKMRTSAGVFKNLQTALRDQAASSLAKKTLYFHEQLADDREYHDLSVDPKNYMIYVKPNDIGDEVPAHSYQGGGHKLLLGIAFKLAIINLVTKPPFILLDEPTYGLDTTHKSKLFDKISKLTKSQLLLITHQRDDREVGGTLLEVVKKGAVSTVEVLS